MGVSALFLKSFHFSLKLWDGLFLSHWERTALLFSFEYNVSTCGGFLGGSDGVIRRFWFYQQSHIKFRKGNGHHREQKHSRIGKISTPSRHNQVFLKG